MQSSVWIFGYGSLIWKKNFPYEEEVVGYVKGYARRFWQASTDHRGVPGAPGRVATLVESNEDCTWGVAYQVNPDEVSNVFEYLNHREKAGYTLANLLFHPIDSTLSSFSVSVYIATETNENYIGPTSIEDIAQQVLVSHGPSGSNTEYVIKLAEAMRRIAPSAHDSHLYELEERVKQLMYQKPSQ